MNDPLLIFSKEQFKQIRKGQFFTLPIKKKVAKLQSPTKDQFVQQLYYRENHDQFDHIIF